MAVVDIHLMCCDLSCVWSWLCCTDLALKPTRSIYRYTLFYRAICWVIKPNCCSWTTVFWLSQRFPTVSEGGTSWYICDSLVPVPANKNHYWLTFYQVHAFTISSLLQTILIPSVKSVSSFFCLPLFLNHLPLSAELSLVIFGFWEGAQWQCWHQFKGLAWGQALGVSPATRVMLLNLPPTNLSAEALYGR